MSDDEYPDSPDGLSEAEILEQIRAGRPLPIAGQPWPKPLPADQIPRTPPPVEWPDRVAPDYEFIPVMPGVSMTNAPADVVQAREARPRAAGRNRPGSIYYPARPPDDDDPWQWCHECRCWHPHSPCF